MTVAWLGNGTQPSVWFGDGQLIYAPETTPADLGQVVFTTAGGTFAPVLELASGSSATVDWLNASGVVIATGLSPTITGQSAIHLRCTSYADITTLNLGFNHTEDSGAYNLGSSYDKSPTDVTGITGLSQLTGLVRFMAAGTALAGHIDFTGLSQLQFIECFHATVQSITLTGCTSLIRLCLERNRLANLDLNPVHTNLRDLRAAVQNEGQPGGPHSLTFTTLGGSMTQLYHYCIRDQTVHNIIPHAQLPVIEEHWAWNTDQTTSDAPTSTLLRSYLSYGNAYDQASVDLILTTLASTITNGAWHTVDLSGGTSAAPSATGLAAKTTLQDNGWNVQTNLSGGGGEEPTEGEYSIWYPAAPSTYSIQNDATSYSLGQPFSLSSDGTITHLGFFKAATDTATSRTLQLWDGGTDTVLALQVTSGEPTGTTQWIMEELTTPLAVVAGEYLVSYQVFNTSGRYVSQQNATWPVSNLPITGLQSGRYTTTPAAKPTGSYNNSSYFADVIFVPEE